MNYNNQIPAWSYANKLNKQAQLSNIPDYGIGPKDPSGPNDPSDMESDMGSSEPENTVRYVGTMNYEVRVPVQPGNPEEELAAADEAALYLYQRIYDTVGDEITSHNPPEKYE
jgi:hypothetical protein